MSPAAWRCALRVARRDALRAKGRTVLVVLLIAFPILVLSSADVAYRTFQLDPGDQVTRNLGRADVAVRKLGDAVRQPADGWLTGFPEITGQTFPPRPVSVAQVRAAVPGAGHVVGRRVLERQWVIRTKAGLQYSQVEEFAYSDPLVRGILRPVAGRAPAGPGEVSLTTRLAGLLHARVGSLLHRADDGTTWRVVGLVRDPQQRSAVDVLVAPGVVPGRADFDGRTFYLHTRGPVTWADVLRLNRLGFAAVSRHVLLHLPPPTQVQVVISGADRMQVVVAAIVIGGMALLEVALLAGPAFAVGARRRQRDLALIAVVGANRRQLRRMVLADGVVAGVLAGVLGAVAGIGLAAGGLPFLAGRVDRDPGAFDVRPVELLALAGVGLATAVLAAALPARRAARGDVVAVLSGRRGSLRSSRALPIAGAVTAAVGLAVAASGATSYAGAYRILAGVALVEAGIIAGTPLLLGAVGRLAGRAPLAIRMALRDLARNRASAAAAVAAVMAAVVGAVGIAIGVTSTVADERQQQGQPFLPLGTALVPLDGPAAGKSAQVAAQLRKALPAASVDVLRTAALCDVDAGGCLSHGLYPVHASGLRPPEPYLGSLLISNAATVSRLLGGGTAAKTASAALAAGRPVVFARGATRWRAVTVPLDLNPLAARMRTVAVHAVVVSTGYGMPSLVLPPSFAAALRLRTVAAGVFATVPGGVDPSVESAVDAALYDIDPGLSLEVPRPFQDRYAALRTAFVLGGGLIAVVAAVISTALARLERRRDLQTLVAVGAAPSMSWRMALTQGAVIASIGTVLGTAVGFVAPAAFVTAANRNRSGAPSDPKMPLAVPWPALILLIVLVTVVAAALSAAFGRPGHGSAGPGQEPLPVG